MLGSCAAALPRWPSVVGGHQHALQCGVTWGSKRSRGGCGRRSIPTATPC